MTMGGWSVKGDLWILKVEKHGETLWKTQKKPKKDKKLYFRQFLYFNRRPYNFDRTLDRNIGEDFRIVNDGLPVLNCTRTGRTRQTIHNQNRITMISLELKSQSWRHWHCYESKLLYFRVFVFLTTRINNHCWRRYRIVKSQTICYVISLVPYKRHWSA